jgi:succinoglycan biosynthesis protein ExoW
MTFDAAVVIPFFQTESGILPRALSSITAQQGLGAVVVIVVDDASPMAAAAEVATLGELPCITIRVVQRPNGGPAAARNTGLAAVPPDTRYVAFLDSDDEWSVDHLARAVGALSRGFDFYFADLLHLGQTTSAFKRAGRIVESEHVALAGLDGVFTYSGDMFDQIMRGNVIGTSTVVFDRTRFAHVRFREEYYSAGEDYLCWMDFARKGARFVFSTHCEAKYGRGVNVYSGAQWGTARHLERVHNEFKYRKATMRLHPVTPEQAGFLKRKKAELREEFTRSLLSMIRRRARVPVRVLARQLALDPVLAIEPLALIARKLSGRLR